jgi:hypothetical protein
MKFSINFPISLLIKAQFIMPILNIAFGLLAVLLTPVPETAIYEKSYMLFSEDKVWFACKKHMTSPTLHAIFSKKLDHSEFGRTVCRTTDSRHIVGTLFLGHGIRSHYYASHDAIFKDL